MSSANRPKSVAAGAEVVFSRSNVIAIAAGVSLVCGIFIPFPRVLFDILWACSLCLTAAILLIAFGAKSAAELAGFPPLMIVAALARMALYTASLRLILKNHTGGTLIETIGAFLSAPGPILAIVITPILAVIVLISVFKSARRISDISFTCITETIPLKRMEVESDVKTGIINPDKARQFNDRYFQEAGFYLNAAGIAKLLRTDAVIAFVVMLVIVAGRLIISVTVGAMSETVLQICAVSSAGSAVLVLSPLLLIALASCRLVEKSSRGLTADSAENPQPGETIEIVSEETGRSEKVELLNPDFAEVAESVVEFEPVGTQPPQDSEAASGPVTSVPQDADEYYEMIADRIADLPPEHLPLLLAGSGNASLPVTVAVNVAIRLAQQNLSTLLIDAEPDRNAIAEVFEVKPELLLETPAQTCIDNLSIWKLNPSADRRRLAQITRTAKHDRVIIYTPDLQDPDLYKILTVISAAAIVFADDRDSRAVRDALVKAGCPVLATFAGVGDR